MKITESDIAWMMFLNLQKQACEWQWIIKNTLDQELKQKFNRAFEANTFLMKEIEKLFTPDALENYWNVSEKFSAALEIIQKAETPQEKRELIEVLMAWSEGAVKVEESDEQQDFNDKNSV